MSAVQGSDRAAPRIIVGRGARATEELLLTDLEALLASSAADVHLLGRPVVVVVPSRSLRLHLAAQIVRRRGRAVAGLEIVTLHGLAAGIVGRCEGPRRAGTRLLPVLVSRFARREPALRSLAASLEDGELPVIATIRDLLDAGYTPANAEAVGEHLEGRGEGGGAGARGGAGEDRLRGRPRAGGGGSRPRLRSAAAGNRSREGRPRIARCPRGRS